MNQESTLANTASAKDPAKAARSAMFIVFLVVFIDLLGFGIVLPLLPLYTVDLLMPIFPNSPERVGLTLAVLMASFSLMQFIFAPIWGRISDRVGRRPILLLGLTGSVVFYGLFGYASYLGFAGQPELGILLILISRVGAGIAGATISTAQAVIADTTTLENRSRGMALIGAAFGIGFTFGPLLCFASLFVESKAAPGGAAAILSFIALCLALRLLPETVRKAEGDVGRRHWFKFGSLLQALRTPAIGSLIIIFFLATVAFGSLESTLALVNQFLFSGGAKVLKMLEMTAEQRDEIFRKSSLIFAYVGFTLLLVQGFFYRRFVRKVGEVRFMRAGTLLMVCGLCGVITMMVILSQGRFGASWQVVIVAMIILAVLVTGFALMTPSVQALISKRADPTRQGEVLGANQSASALARILGPALGPSLFFLDPAHVLPYIVGAGLMTIVFLLTLRLRQD